MKKLFKDWKAFEIGLLLFGVIAIVFSSVICKSQMLTILASLVGVICSLSQAKGKVFSQFIGIAEVILYSILSYQNHYYGEVIIDVVIVFPMYVYGVISWMTHKNEETDTVEPNQISKKEWGMLILASAIGFVVLYYILKYFNTSQLLISSLSMITSLIATYLITRRSKYSFLFYIGNDVILILLWGIPILQGDFYLLPILVENIVLLMNDSYRIEKLE